jgi:uncharacterized protein YggE
MLVADRIANYVTLGFAAVGIILMILILTGCAGPVPAANSNETQPTISVNGSGEATAVPDVVFVSLGIQVQANDLGEAIVEANGTMNTIFTALQAEGLEEKDMQTSGFNVRTENIRDRDGNPTGQAVYHVNNTVRLTVRDLENTGDIIGAALDAGANSVNGLNFGIENNDELLAEARTAAVADARARAEQLAEGLGVTVGKPITISEQGGVEMPLQRNQMADVAFAEAATAPPISGGELTVSSQVYVVFELIQ